MNRKPIEFEKIISYVKRKARDFELYSVEADTLNVEVTNGCVDFISENKSKGLGVRIARRRRVGFAYTTNIANFKKCINSAAKIAKLNEKDNNFESFAPRRPFKRIKSAHDSLLEFDSSDFCDFNSEFVKNVQSVKKGIVVSSGTYRKNITERRIVNSEGVDAEDISADNIVFYDFSIKFRGNLESLPVAYCERRPFDPKIGIESGERFVEILGKRKVKGGSFPMVFHPDALGELLDVAFTFDVNADNVQRGKSLFRDMLGERIFDSKLNIYDDGINPRLYMSKSFDCEGHPTQRTALVERGVLKSFLHDSYTARRDGVESTGNAHRSVNSVPEIDANNIIISPGKSKNPLAGIDKGLYVRSLLGCHTMDSATGDFSLGVMEGFYIEKGEKKFPVKDVMVAGNLFEMMGDVLAIGNRMMHSPSGNGGCYMPEIAFSNVRLIGKN